MTLLWILLTLLTLHKNNGYYVEQRAVTGKR